MRISIVQTDIVWENKEENLRRLHDKLAVLHNTTDLVVLPEMFSTGFSMNSHALAEPTDGNTITTLRSWAKKYNFALTGSYIATEDGHYYNRAFFLTPEGEEFYYDKRHLFRMGNEIDSFSPGSEKIIIPYRGWYIRLLVCYDIRFPVWSRNISNEYDLLIYVANWPESRQIVWDTLLLARALENMCYTCGVNRIGTDANNLSYTGGSVVYSPKGERLAEIKNNEEGIATTELSLTSLQEFREKFPAWKDADNFDIR